MSEGAPPCSPALSEVSVALFALLRRLLRGRDAAQRAAAVRIFGCCLAAQARLLPALLVLASAPPAEEGAAEALGAMVARAGNAVWSMAKGGGGGAPPECPAGRLAHEVRGVYARERREGVFEEPALTAAIVAFAAVVLGRCTDFVTVEGNADLARGGG